MSIISECAFPQSVSSLPPLAKPTPTIVFPARFLVEHARHDVSLQEQVPLELRDRVATTDGATWRRVERLVDVRVRAHDARAEHEREHELVVGEQRDRGDLVDARSQSADHLLELGVQVVFADRFGDLE